MPKIKITMEGGSPSLNADGGIYRVPVDPSSTPVIGGVRVRKTREWEGEIAGGRYEYRFAVQNGDGKYRLDATYAGQGRPFASSDEMDAEFQDGNVFYFEVRG
jgi:hypothetical protein